MPRSNAFKSHLKLHIVVFIWGFTAILGDVISLEAISLVWNRILIALVVLLGYILIKKIPLKIDAKTLAIFSVAGMLITAHWITFFHAIKISNVSVTLVCMSSGAFFASLLEPIFYKRKLLIHEVVLGLIVIGAIAMVFSLRIDFLWGIITALTSALLAALFSIINGKMAHKNESETITFYELLAGWLSICVVLLFTGDLNFSILPQSQSDWLYLLILGTICTAYPFIESVRVMKLLSPFTVILSINMEPVYGIILAYFLLGDDEKMSPAFYTGALLIIGTLFANAWFSKRLVSNKKPDPLL